MENRTVTRFERAIPVRNRATSSLWASLHERLAGTKGVHELAELQRRFEENEPTFCKICETPIAPDDHKTREYGLGFVHDDCWFEAE